MSAVQLKKKMSISKRKWHIFHPKHLASRRVIPKLTSTVKLLVMCSPRFLAREALHSSYLKSSWIVDLHPILTEAQQEQHGHFFKQAVVYEFLFFRFVEEWIMELTKVQLSLLGTRFVVSSHKKEGLTLINHTTEIKKEKLKYSCSAKRTCKAKY